MVSGFNIAGKLYKGLSYHEYTDRTKIKLLSINPDNLTPDEKESIEYTRLNLQRSLRIEKNYTVSEDLRRLVESIQNEQLWMIITEDWCGDSAQNLPHIFRISECNPKITLRILLRDSNPEVMDLYLTDGTRSIPKLVAFDSAENEIFKWGPRPQKAKDLFIRLKRENMPKPMIYERIHKWYSENKGQELEKEFTEIISVLLHK